MVRVKCVTEKKSPLTVGPGAASSGLVVDLQVFGVKELEDRRSEA